MIIGESSELSLPEKRVISAAESLGLNPSKWSWKSSVTVSLIRFRALSSTWFSRERIKIQRTCRCSGARLTFAIFHNINY